jgi:hypothetical protein
MRRQTCVLILAAGVAMLGGVIAERENTAHGQALTAGGDISARGAFTCELTLSASVAADSPEPIAAALERDRMIMARRPGILRKHIPLSFDAATGNLLAGGRYLLDTEEHARQYKAFVESYALDGVKFFERPIFLDHDCHSWSVIGARDFADVHTTHVVLRTERWQVPPANQRKWLEARWAAVRSEAQARGLTSVWLLYNQAERLVTLVYFADRLGPQDPTIPDFASLTALQTAPPLGDLLDDFDYVKIFDRTQWSWTIWFPVLAGDRGEPARWPNSPALPEPYSGDGVCEVSRGENHQNSPTDCGPTCGDTVCQIGESSQRCPGDCAVTQ